jgi:hypothetical protein
MKAAQVKQICVKWGISQAKLGRFLGMSPRRLRRVLDGEYPMRAAEALLLNSMLEHDERPL